MKKSLLFSLVAIPAILYSCNCKDVKKECDAIIVTKATMKMLPDSVASFKEVAKRVVANSRQEEGCLSYAFYQDVADSTTFFLYEEYINRDALNIHLNKGYLEEFRTARHPMLDGDIPYVVYSSIATDNTVISRDMLKFDMKLSD